MSGWPEDVRENYGFILSYQLELEKDHVHTRLYHRHKVNWPIKTLYFGLGTTELLIFFSSFD